MQSYTACSNRFMVHPLTIGTLAEIDYSGPAAGVHPRAVRGVASCAYSSRLRRFSGTSIRRADRTHATRARGNTGGDDDRSSLHAARRCSLMLQAGLIPTGSCLQQWLFCLSLRLLLRASARMMRAAPQASCPSKLKRRTVQQGVPSTGRSRTRAPGGRSRRRDWGFRGTDASGSSVAADASHFCRRYSYSITSILRAGASG